MKKRLLSASMVLFLTVTSQGPVFASMGNQDTIKTENLAYKEQIIQENQLESIEKNTDNYIDKLEKYVIVNEDKTLSLDPAHVFELDIPLSFTSGIQEGLDYLNGLIKSNKAVVNTDLSVTMLDDYGKGNISVMSRARGRSGHDLYWWGYNIFLNSNETRTTYQSFKAGGGATAGLAAIARFIPVPPTQLASAIAGVIGGGLVAYGQMIQDEHKGNGVRMRFTGLGYAAVPTGVFPQ